MDKPKLSAMQRAFKIIDCIYLLLLGVGVGAIIACGAFTAPIVFNMASFTSQEASQILTVADSGQVMGQIFLRLNTYLIILLVLMPAYEIASLVYRPQYPKLWLLLALFAAGGIGLFAWFYTPFILDASNLESENFDSMHKQSVWVFQAIMISLSLLFIGRAYSLHSKTG